MRILIVDDEEVALNSIKRLLKWRGIRNVDTCANGKDAIAKIKETDFDIVLLDLLMPEVDGLQVLEAAKPYRPHTEFIILTAIDDIPTTVKAIRLGAYDYLVKPVDNDLLFLAIRRAYEHRGLLIGLSTTAGYDKSSIPAAFAEIVTQCPRMCSLLSYAQIMAGGGNPIMITGESGTGKELIARGIHRAGPMPGGPFIAVNVGPFFWMKSGNCPLACSPNCCGYWKKSLSIPWALPSRSGWMSGLSPLPTEMSRRRARTEVSGWIFFTV